MAQDGPFASALDQEINSIDRAELALNFSNDALAYERVLSSLQNGGFDKRKIVLDGDSLTRQLFISLGCLAWHAGYVEQYFLGDVHEYPPSGGPLANAHFKEPSKLFVEGHIKLIGGGEIYFNTKPESLVVSQTNDHVEAACNNTKIGKQKKRIQAHIRSRDETIVMGRSDVYVVAGDHHANRNTYLSAYKKVFQCMEDAHGSNAFYKWPKFFYQSSSVTSFWTESGAYTAKPIEGMDANSCRPTVHSAARREKESVKLGDLVSFLGNIGDIKDLGRLHMLAMAIFCIGSSLEYLTYMPLNLQTISSPTKLNN